MPLQNVWIPNDPGYFSSLRNIEHMIQCDEALRCLTFFPEIPQLQYVVYRTMNAWGLVTQDTQLIQVAFSTRVLFLRHLILYGQALPQWWRHR